MYLYGIYPEGGFSLFLIIAISLYLFILAVLATDNDSLVKVNGKTTKSTWYQLGKLKWIIPSVLVFFLFLANLVPDKKTFLLIVATPYLMEQSGKVLDQLDNSNSKLYKVNKLIDQSLDKAIQKLEQ